MVMLKITDLRFWLAELLGQIAKRGRLHITITRRKTAITAEKTQLKRNPYPARPGELTNEAKVVEAQAPGLEE